MNVKKYLEQIQVYDKKINNKLIELEQLRVMAEGVGAVRYDKEKVQGTPNHDIMSKAIEKIIDMEEELNKDIDEFVDMRRERIKVLEQLDNALEYEVLHKRYVQYKDLSTIAKEMHYSKTNVDTIHRRGIKQLSEKIV